MGRTESEIIGTEPSLLELDPAKEETGADNMAKEARIGCEIAETKELLNICFLIWMKPYHLTRNRKIQNELIALILSSIFYLISSNPFFFGIRQHATAPNLLKHLSWMRQI